MLDFDFEFIFETMKEKLMTTEGMVIVGVIIVLIIGVGYYLFTNKDKLLGGMSECKLNSFMTDFNKEDNKENNKEMNKNGSLVLYYSNKCSACDIVKPLWFETKKKLNNKIEMIEIDGEENMDELIKYNIEAYPTIGLFIGEKLILYEGDKYDYESLNKFVSINLL
jgi:thiol-disulfide isomerase/thioredoxin